MMGRPEEIEKFGAYLQALPHKHKVVIAGNHDWLFQTKPKVARKLIGDVDYLQDSAVVIDGVKFYGAPWQPEFCNWAFNVPRGPAIRAKWDLIPSDVDVLITHGPPFGHLDTVRPRPLSLGCEMLRKVVDEKRPRFHIFGHIHDGYGMKTVDNTTFINAAVCNERYQPVNAPIVFDIGEHVNVQ